MKRIMRSFSLGEISAVDVPAQAGAKLAIMKRDITEAELDALTAETMAAIRKEHVMDFAKLVAETRKANRKMSFGEAAAKVRRENPDAFEAHVEALENDDADHTDEPVRVTKSAAEIAFGKRVAEIRSTRKGTRGRPMTHTEAMQVARRENPDVFAEAYPEHA